MVDLFCICSKTLLLYSLTAADEGPGKRQSRFLQIICCKLYHRVCMCVIPMRLRAEEGPMQRSLTLTPPPAATLGGLSQRTCELWKVPCESSPASAGLELTAPFLRADHLRLSGQDGNTYCVRSYGCASAMGQTARFGAQIPGVSRVSGGFPPETYSCSLRVCCDGALVSLMVEFLTCFKKIYYLHMIP